MLKTEIKKKPLAMLIPPMSDQSAPAFCSESPTSDTRNRAKNVAKMT